MQYTVIIVEEATPPRPRFPRYDILVPWVALESRHLNTTQCDKGAERKQWRLVAE